MTAFTAGAPTRFPQTVLATCCLPLRPDGALDEQRFASTCEALIDRGLENLYVFGTAGEGHAVSDSMFRAVVDLFVAVTSARGARPMVGIISTSLPTVLERVRWSAERGVTAFQISLPSWGPLNDREVRAFFTAVCDGFPELQFMHYNLARTGRLLRPTDYRPLVDAHPNLVATKYGGGDPELVAGLMTQVPELRHFFTELGFYTGAPLGSCGLLASISTSNPDLAIRYFQAGQRGGEEFSAMYRELARMMARLRAAVGPTAHIDGAFDKIVVRLLDPDFPLRLLPPYAQAPEDAFHAYETFLATELPHWLAGPTASDPTPGSPSVPAAPLPR